MQALFALWTHLSHPTRLAQNDLAHTNTTVGDGAVRQTMRLASVHSNSEQMPLDIRCCALSPPRIVRGFQGSEIADHSWK